MLGKSLHGCGVVIVHVKLVCFLSNAIVSKNVLFHSHAGYVSISMVMSLSFFILTQTHIQTNTLKNTRTQTDTPSR